MVFFLLHRKFKIAIYMRKAYMYKITGTIRGISSKDSSFKGKPQHSSEQKVHLPRLLELGARGKFYKYINSHLSETGPHKWGSSPVNLTNSQQDEEQCSVWIEACFSWLFNQLEACFMPPIVKNSGQKSLEEKKPMWEIMYVSLRVQQNNAVLLVLNSIPNINVHGRQKSSTGRVLVPVTSLHSVCGLYIIRHNGTNSLSFSPAVSLLSMALHWCHWEHLAQSPSFLFFF